MLSADAIVELHDRQARAWHELPPSPGQSPHSTATEMNAGSDPTDTWLDIVARQHRANFDLWHIEDKARSPGATDADLAQIKRRIDITNQLRNDLSEELDGALLRWLEPRGLPNQQAPLNSESPGLIIDRLSILALKIYHTREEIERKEAPAGHSSRNLDRLVILETQRGELADCLDALWRETLAGSRRFKVYRQLKMYNDPSLNPAVYRKSPHRVYQGRKH